MSQNEADTKPTVDTIVQMIADRLGDTTGFVKFLADAKAAGVDKAPGEVACSLPSDHSRRSSGSPGASPAWSRQRTFSRPRSTVDSVRCVGD